MAVLPVGIGPVTGGYQIERSLRFNPADTAYLSRTFSTPTNNKKWTMSGWMKRSAINDGNYNTLFSRYVDGNNFMRVDLLGDNLRMYQYKSANDVLLRSTLVLRDPSAYYHFLVIYDSDNATSSNRVLFYINNTQITSFSSSTYPSSGSSSIWNTSGGATHQIGTFNANGSGEAFSGLMTECYFIDGQALTPSSFGETDSATGVWKPIDYTGTYGTNGFYLNFSNNTSTQSLGWDQQGNITRYATAGTYSYTVPSYSSSLVVEVWGGGGGGGQALLPGTDATNGGQSSFNGTVVANGGNRGVGASSGVGANGTGGTASGGDTNTTGNTGNSTAGASSSTPSPNSGNSAIAGVIGPGGFNGITGYPVGSGGGGAYWTGGSVPTGGAGGSGGYSKKTYAPGAISGTITVVVGAGGSAGVGGALNGGAGTAGMVRITIDGATTPSDWYERNSFSVSAGAGNDSLVDTPTQYGTDTGAGGEVRGNYCTLNPLNKNTSGTLSNGNLEWQASTTAVQAVTGTSTIISSGKTYFEVNVVTAAGASNYYQLGVVPFGKSLTTDIGVSSGNGYAIEQNGNSDIRLRLNGTSVTVSTVVQTGDVLQVAVDYATGKLWFGRNNTWYNSSGGTTGNPGAGTNETATISTTTDWFPAVAKYNTGGSYAINFGQRPFAYTAPSGFKALCTTNLPTPTIGATSTTQANDYFTAYLYTADGTSPKSRTGIGFAPDFLWFKVRSTTFSHALYDIVRGTDKGLQTNTTNAENNYTLMSAFGSDGFTTTTDGTVGNLLNDSTNTYVTWAWKANGAGSSNTAGTITSTVSANTTAGFSIVTFTMPSSGTSDTVGHGLGVAPAMVIVKARGTTSSWGVYHKNLTSAAYYLRLQTTDAQTLGNNYWNSTAPTSTVFTLGSTWYGSGTMVAYCFAPVAGYSAFGSYTGNGSADGVFVYLGFRPRFMMIKRTDTTADWVIYDSARDTYNVNTLTLYPNLSNAEGVVNPANDFLSNGFKARNSTSTFNANGGTYIYAAFAESPFKYSLAR